MQPEQDPTTDSPLADSEAKNVDAVSLSPKGRSGGVTFRAVLIALFFTTITGFWVRHSEIMVLATQITESVPAIPGLTALSLLLLINLILKRTPRARPLQRAELIFVFLFVTVSSMTMGIGVVQFLFALITTPFYKMDNGEQALHPLLPKWLAPHDTDAVRRLYESSMDGKVPWNLWLVPGLCWMAFFVALGFTLYCLMALFYRAWAQDERLSFPLVALPLEMTNEGAGGASFFRNRLMWMGFALAAAYNLVNICHAFYPSIPAFGKEFDLSPSLASLPLSAAQPLSMHFRPEQIGLGYLVSTEISLTVWLSYLLLKIGAIAAAAGGYEPRQLYPMEQGIGAYLVLAGVLTWLARRRLAAAWRDLFTPHAEVGPEGMRGRWAVLGFLGGTLFCWAFMTLAGMAWWVSGSYLAIVLAVAMVYGRLRAQTGVPMVWLFPYHQQKAVLLYTFGSQPFANSGSSTLAVWAMFAFLARGYFPTISGYHIESMELARREGLNSRRLFFALMFAIALGFAFGWYHHLTPYYQRGALQLRGDIWGYWVAVPEYQTARSYALTTQHADFTRITATGAGGITVFLLSWLRLKLSAFPLHPLGYAMSCCFGGTLWASFFIVWVVKSLVLRYGGMRLYRQSIPFFLGFALGHFALAGIFWGLLGVWSGEAVRGYEVFFG